MTGFYKPVLWLALAAVMPECLSAQETSTITTPKSVSKLLTIDSAEVIYVSGDDAVLKLPNGGLRLYESKPGTPLIVDGKVAKPSDLSPGMNISHLQLQTEVTSDVTSVKRLSGRVTAKNGRWLTIRQDDGTSKIYRVPFHATFNVNGKDTGFDSIATGTKIDVTAVTTSGLTAQYTNSAKVASTPPQQGTLVIGKS